MNYLENVKVAMQSVKSNKLRTFLTALIIAFGLMALVGILTSIDAMADWVAQVIGVVADDANAKAKRFYL